MKNIIFLLAFFLVISACNTGDETADGEKIVSPPLKKESVVYVLFDYSKSLDANSFKTTADRASKLVRNCPVGMTLKFLPINNDPFAQPIFSYTRKPKPNKPHLVQAWETQNIELGAKIAKLIEDMHQKGNVNSCIAHGFSTVYNHVKTLPKDGNIKLIVLSDLLECCDNMTCAQSVKGFKKLLKELNKYNFGACPLSQHIPYNNITLVINSSDLTSIKEIYNSPDREFYQFWEIVAKGMGYEKGFVMSPNLPVLTN